MNLTAIVHAYPPHFNAGGEWMLHSIFKWLVGQGHEVSVITKAEILKGAEELDGVHLYGFKESPTEVMDVVNWADILVTHLDLGRVTTEIAKSARKPVVHVIHNPWYLSHWKFRTDEIDLAVFNTAWLLEDQKWPGPQTICRPSVWTRDYRVEKFTGEGKVTLLNLNANKGGILFWELARMLPGIEFLGVLGAYGDQVIKPAPRNVEIIPHSSNVRDEVYARTGILLVPSKFESYGRVSLEAAASGIPVICSKAEGLQEAMGPDGTYLDLKSYIWAKHISFLKGSPDAFAEASTRAFKRSQEVSPVVDLVRLEKCLFSLLKGPKIHWVDKAPSWSSSLKPEVKGSLLSRNLTAEDVEASEVPCARLGKSDQKSTGHIIGPAVVLSPEPLLSFRNDPSVAVLATYAQPAQPATVLQALRSTGPSTSLVWVYVLRNFVSNRQYIRGEETRMRVDDARSQARKGNVRIL